MEIKLRLSKSHHQLINVGIILLLGAWMQVTVFASTAAAFFEQGHLIQVVYDPDTNQMGTDLGLIGTTPLDFSQQNVELKPKGSVDPNLLSADQWSNLKLAYYSYTNNPFLGSTIWFATTSPKQPKIVTTATSTFLSAAAKSAIGFTRDVNGGSIGTNPAVVASSIVDGFYTAMNGGYPDGSYAGYNDDFKVGEALLDELDNGNYVDMYLYRFDGGKLNPGVDPGTDYQAVLRLNADGSTVLNPASADQCPHQFELD